VLNDRQVKKGNVTKQLLSIIPSLVLTGEQNADLLIHLSTCRLCCRSIVAVWKCRV